MEGGYGTTSTAVDITSNGYGRPIAIQCYPLLVQLESASATNSTIITPFPTLYWLTCPHVSRAISELERAGYARIFWERLLFLQHPEQSFPMISDCDSKVGTSNIMDMQVMEAEVDTSSIEWKNQWRDCHEEYASERWNSLSVEDQRRLLSSPQFSSSKYATHEQPGVGNEDDTVEDDIKRESMRRILQYSGVAGTEYQYHYHDNDDDDDDFTMTRGSNSRKSGSRSPLPSVKCLHAHYAHYRSQISSINNGSKIEREQMAINIVGKWTHEQLMERFPDILF